MASVEEKPPPQENAEEKVESSSEMETAKDAATVEEDKKPAAVNASTLPAAMQNSSSAFEDDGTFALPPDQSYTTATPGAGANATNSKGAQVLMSRFSNWRQQANENANILWKQAKEAQAQAAANNQGALAVLRQVSGVNVGSGTPSKNDQGGTSPMNDPVEPTNKTSDEGDRKGGDDKNVEDGFMVYGDERQDKDKPDDTPTNARTLPNLPTRQELRSRAQFVASGLVESLDTYAPGFRGRYANNGMDAPKPPPASPHSAAKESQTALILKSRAAAHLQDILDSLEPYQYVLLLGAGRLQVNLKNPYVKHQGTYVDYLVQGGAADKSGVVSVGDSIVRVGSQDVRKQTIADVPSIIANAKRPVVLVLTTGIELELERITYLDLAVAMIHQIRAKDEQQKQEMIASAQKNKSQAESEEGSGEQQDEDKEETPDPEPMEDKPKEEEPQEKSPPFDDVKIPSINTVEDYSSPPQPPMTARLAYKHLVGKRCVSHAVI